MAMRKGIGKMLFWGVVVVFALAMGHSIAERTTQFYRLHEEKVKTEQEIKILREEQARLQKEKSSLNDPKYIEKVAREEHNMVKENEVRLFIIDKNKQKDASSPDKKAQQDTDKKQ